MITLVSRRRLRQLEDLEHAVEILRRDNWTLSCTVLQERAEKALIVQARERADVDVAYWKTRAERFLDQIGINTGIIVAPTMTEPAEPSVDKMEGLFAALSVATINQHKEPSSSAASAAPRVEGVDPAAAQAAIDATLADVGRLA